MDSCKANNSVAIRGCKIEPHYPPASTTLLAVSRVSLDFHPVLGYLPVKLLTTNRFEVEAFGLRTAATLLKGAAYDPEQCKIQCLRGYRRILPQKLYMVYYSIETRREQCRPFPKPNPIRPKPRW